MTSMREALEKAYDNDVGQAEDTSSPAGDELVSESPEPTGEPVTESADTPPEQADESSTEEKASLKFLPAEETEGEEKPGEESAERPGVVERAPVGWRGEAKGHWSELPPPVRQEVLRREREMGRVTREMASARTFQQEFDQVISPFRAFIEAEQSTPLQAVQNVMRTAIALRVGAPQQKAALVADIIRQFQVDVGAVDNMLAGGQPAEGQNSAAPDMAMQQYLDQRLAPVNDLLNRFQTAEQTHQEQVEQQAQADIDNFLNSDEAEYFEDLREDMADFLDMAHQRGQKLSMKEAYRRALALHPELSTAIAQKKATAERQAQVAAQQASIEKKKRASASVQGIPPGSNGASPPTNMRDQLMAAWDAQEGGGGI